MKKLKVSLKNCYGINKLDYEFDFSEKSTFAIYSPNGIMKTSFAKTFKDVSTGDTTSDKIFNERTTVRKITNENDVDIDGKNILVIEPYNETYKSEKLSTLLVNAKLKNDYEKIHIEINTKKMNCLKSSNRYLVSEPT